jgi:hypothetical protein
MSSVEGELDAGLIGSRLEWTITGGLLCLMLF